MSSIRLSNGLGVAGPSPWKSRKTSRLFFAREAGISRAPLWKLVAVEEYRARRLSDAQFRRLLGLSRVEAGALLHAHGVWLDCERRLQP